MDCFEAIAETPDSAYKILFRAAISLPLWHYFVGLLLFCIVVLYNFLEFHFFQDLFTGFRGVPVLLTYNPSSEIYHGVVAKCRTLHGRYLATPWLSSPHIQTSFVNFLGRPPVFTYRRCIMHLMVVLSLWIGYCILMCLEYLFYLTTPLLKMMQLLLWLSSQDLQVIRLLLWVRALNEYVGALLSSPFMHVQKKAENTGPHSVLAHSLIDQGPYLNVADGMVAAMGNDRTDGASETSEQNKNHDDGEINRIVRVPDNHDDEPTVGRKPESATSDVKDSADTKASGRSVVQRCLNQLSRQNNKSIWLLAYIALVSSWPIVGAALGFLFKRKFKGGSSAGKVQPK